jgi:TolB protein
MSADGGQLRQLTDDPGQERSPDWAPDSEHLVFHGDRTGRYEVWIISVSDPSTPRQLTFDGGSQARWSPDGRFIAYLHEGPPTHLRIVSADGGDPVTLINNQDPAITARPEELRWSADSREIYYKAYDADGISSFWAVPVTGGEPRLLVRFDDPAMHSNRDDFASDGRNLYFTIGAMESDVWVMELIGN